MIGKLIDLDGKGEIFNFGGKERLSRMDMGEILCREAGFDKGLIERTTMEMAGSVYKVADVSMSVEKISGYGISPKSFRDSVKEVLTGKNHE